jgi:antitoxin component YwqK of YwqJK toxin-antitoxin module
MTRTSWQAGLMAAAVAVLTGGCATSKEAAKGDDTAAKGEPQAEVIRKKQADNETVTEFDLNGDRKADVWSYAVTVKGEGGKDIERVSRKELDINWDGKVDISRTYDEREQINREALDLDFDGKVDQVNFYEKGVIVRKELDLSATGRPSEFKFYEKGKLVRKERDTNGDGKVDYWEYWEGDQVDRVGVDLDGDGNVDKWEKNPNSES